MDPTTLSMVQLKKILKQHDLSTAGRKAELIARMLNQDPTGSWVMTAANRAEETDDEELARDDEVDESAQHEHSINQERKIKASELRRKEAELQAKERSLMEKEIGILRRENEMLRASPGPSVVSSSSRTTLSIKNISDLLSEYSGSGDDFNRWRAQVNLLKNTYELDENSVKVLIGSKLRGKAKEWYYSLADNLVVRTDDLLGRIDNMFNQPMSMLERRRSFEARKWKESESFNEYCHDKTILGNLVPVEEEEMVDYIVEGIPSESLRNQARMHSFKTMNGLLQGFKQIKLTGVDTTMTRDRRVSQHFRSDNMKLKVDGTNAKPRMMARGSSKCYNCGKPGHLARSCLSTTERQVRPGDREGTPKERIRGERQVGTIEDDDRQSITEEKDTTDELEEVEVHYVDQSESQDEFERKVKVQTKGGKDIVCVARIDTGCPITLVRENIVKEINKQAPDESWNKFQGINKSKLEITGIIAGEINMENESQPITLAVVPDRTMLTPLLLGRDTLRSFGYKLTRNVEFDKAANAILNINDNHQDENNDIKINPAIDLKYSKKLTDIFNKYYREPTRPELPEIQIKASLILKDTKLVQFGPRRLSYSDKEKVQKILDNLLGKGIIRKSTSEYSSPIVLTRKKNGDVRMCVDYRALNKMIARDNYPLPLIEDHLGTLKGKKYFSMLDLKDGFYHIEMSPESTKYTSFVTPLGQFEFIRMPFGLKIGPQLFQRFINEVLAKFIKKGAVVVYMDDILIATETLDSHIATLKEIFQTLVENKLDLRLDKCSFLYTQVEYLGYKIRQEGIQPTSHGIKAIQDFPEPTTTKQVQSFVGLASYFRKFIKGFAIIARPLYNLLKKDITFKFGKEESDAFDTLKRKLIESPILTIYDPKANTELHCDASAQGFGAILMQKRDNKMHPVFYFSKRTTEIEAKYHSFELETLAIVYALRRFRIYLEGIPFVIISDCNAVTQTLEKRDINARIARWSLELQNFDFRVVHRSGSQMAHVDALSRSFGVLIIEDNPFEWNLTILQSKDPSIKEIACKLETMEDPQYELREGLVYKKQGGNLLFLVPQQMEKHILFRYHNEMGHIGVGKMADVIKRTYWFSEIRKKCEQHVRNCLKCISFSPASGKIEGYLNPIPKGKIPFETIHIDHLGPIDQRVIVKKYILVVVDAFSKFIKLYPTKTTNSMEAITNLKQFFQNYNKPNNIISDRGTAFTSKDFADFIKQEDITHIKVATGSPQANGQAERMNRIVGPIMAKLSDNEDGKQWYKNLPEVEYAINNTTNRSTGKSPSEIVFGFNQRGNCTDSLKRWVEKIANNPTQSIQVIREQAAAHIVQAQKQQKISYDKKRKAPREYGEGDLIMVKNFDNTQGISKKLIPRFRGPYQIEKVLRNNRYVIVDPPGFQNTQKLYKGVWDVSNIRPWLALKDLDADRVTSDQIKQ